MLYWHRWNTWIDEMGTMCVQSKVVGKHWTEALSFWKCCSVVFLTLHSSCFSLSDIHTAQGDLEVGAFLFYDNNKISLAHKLKILMMLIFLLCTWEPCVKMGYCQVNIQTKLEIKAIHLALCFHKDETSCFYW